MHIFCYFGYPLNVCHKKEHTRVVHAIIVLYLFTAGLKLVQHGWGDWSGKLSRSPVTTSQHGIPKQPIRLGRAFWVALSLIYYGLTCLVYFMLMLLEFQLIRLIENIHFSMLVTLHQLITVLISKMKESLQCKHSRLRNYLWRICMYIFMELHCVSVEAFCTF